MGNPWTPGPWALTEDQRIVGVDGVTPVAEPTKLNISELNRVKADRVLIAAAPEMAEVLDNILRNFPRFNPDHYPVIGDDIRAARALLARIRGETP